MTENAPISTKDASKIVEYLDTLKTTVKSQRDDMMEVINERDNKIEDLEEELGTYGSKFADTEAKMTEMATKMAESMGSIQPALDQIDALQAKLDDPRFGAEGDVADAERKECIDFFHQKHVVQTAGDERMSEFKESSLSEDDFTGYSVAKKAFSKIMRMKTNIPDHNAHLNAEEQKAISTFSYGSEMMLQTEMSNQILECWEEDTHFEGLLDRIVIGKEAIQYMVSVDNEEEIIWNCEADCAPKPGTDPVEMGLRTYTTGEARVEHCITNRMLEDSEIDIPKLLIEHVARKMQKGERRAYMTGDGRNKPDGILNDGNHVKFPSGVHSSATSGNFDWQDLVALYWKFPAQFRNGASWMFHEDALVKLFTLTDGDGNPKMGRDAFAQTGIPRLMGKEVRENTYMPEYLNAGVPIVGSLPIALGNWKEGYLRVERKQFSVLRDPWSNVRCGVTWHFTRRFGGGPKCENAMWFMEIA